jgi:hypothetical protein
MTSEHRITQISGGDGSAIHSYFDLSPESPDGELVAYFSFLGSPPGLGQTRVTERHGDRTLTLGEPVYGSAHHAALQQWVDERLVVYSVLTDDGPATEIVSADGETRGRLNASIRMFSSASGLGLCDQSAARARGLEGGEEAIHLVDPYSGEVRQVFTREEVLEIHPWRERLSAIQHVRFQNSKWAPDGKSLFTVYTNEVHVRRGGSVARLKSLIVADAADGYRPRYLAEFDHHPMWGLDSSSIYAHVRQSDGAQDLVAFPLDGSTPYPLGEEIPGVHATLSPDGRSILTHVYDWPERGEASVLLIDLQTGCHHELATMNAPDASHETGCHLHPVWSRDGRRLYFNSNDSGVARLYAVDLLSVQPGQ